MAVKDMRSIKLITPQKQQLSPQTKAADILFSDGDNLQHKYESGVLGVQTSASVIAPTVTVVKNTSTEFRLQIKAVNGIITTPNLKGVTSEQLAVQIQNAVASLETRVANLASKNELVQNITAVNNKINTNTRRIAEIDTTIRNIETKLTKKVDVATYNSDKQALEFLISSSAPQEFSSVNAFPETGEAGKLYVDRAEDMLYRWDVENGKYVLLYSNSIYDALTNADIDMLF